jgi:hypothetical protein
MLTILVFEINKGKNAQKVKKNNHHLSLLIRGGQKWSRAWGCTPRVPGQKIFEIGSTEMPFPAI